MATMKDCSWSDEDCFQALVEARRTLPISKKRVKQGMLRVNSTMTADLYLSRGGHNLMVVSYYTYLCSRKSLVASTSLYVFYH